MQQQFFLPRSEPLPAYLYINSNDFSVQVKVTIGAQLAIAKIVIIILDQLEIYRRNKIYFISSFILVKNNYPGAANITFSSQIAALNIPNDYGPQFSRNCTLGIVTLTHVNNSQQKQFMYNYSTAMGFTDIQEVSAGATT